MMQKVESDGKLHYPVPQAFTIHSKKNEEWPTSVKHAELSYAEVKNIHDKCKEMGFDTNAIVARRHKGMGQDWRRTSHLQWGVVSHLVHQVWNGQEPYAPIKVHWFQPSSHEGVISEGMWPHELYVVHPSVTRDHLEEWFELQEDD